MITEEFDDDGPAFPGEYFVEVCGLREGQPSFHAGMSLRDYFRRALTGILRAMSGRRDRPGVSKLAYQIADAMLEARKV